MKNKKSKKDEFEYDCDCLVCMAMQRAENKGRELGLEELKESMQKQNYLNFINEIEEDES